MTLLTLPFMDKSSATPLHERTLGTATLYLEDSHIEEVALMGRGIFWLKLSLEKATSDLISQSPTSVGGRIILMVPWYRGFNVADFDTRFHIPRHPVTILFPGLVAKLCPIVRDLGTHFG